MVEDAYIRQCDAAKLIGVTRQVIGNYIARGHLKVTNRYGSPVIRRADLIALAIERGLTVAEYESSQKAKR